MEERAKVFFLEEALGEAIDACRAGATRPSHCQESRMLFETIADGLEQAMRKVKHA